MFSSRVQSNSFNLSALHSADDSFREFERLLTEKKSVKKVIEIAKSTLKDLQRRSSFHAEDQGKHKFFIEGYAIWIKKMEERPKIISNYKEWIRLLIENRAPLKEFQDRIGNEYLTPQDKFPMDIDQNDFQELQERFKNKFGDLYEIPFIEYVMRIYDQFSEDQKDFVIHLFTKITFKTDDQDTFKSILFDEGILRKDALEIIEKFIKAALEPLKNSTNVWRESNVTTRVLFLYIKNKGFHWLSTFLSAPLYKIEGQKDLIERKEDLDEKKDKEAFDNFHAFLNGTFDEILGKFYKSFNGNSIERFPQEIMKVLYLIHKHTLAKFPKEAESLKHIEYSFLFLNIINPCILNPALFGLSESACMNKKQTSSYFRKTLTSKFQSEINKINQNFQPSTSETAPKSVVLENLPQPSIRETLTSKFQSEINKINQNFQPSTSETVLKSFAFRKSLTTFKKKDVFDWI